MIELQERVISDNGDIGFVKEVTITFPSGSEKIFFENFVSAYTEYVDPLELEIQRLNTEIKKLKVQLKPFRRPRKQLSAGEISEIRELITRGEGNGTLATEYECSTSRISRIRTEMKKENKIVNVIDN